jgi:hypothetical protein
MAPPRQSSGSRPRTSPADASVPVRRRTALWPLLAVARARRSAGAASLRVVRGAKSPDGGGRDADERLDLGVYIGRELERGRPLFEVLGDAFVWTNVQDDPNLLSRVANDERVLAALARQRAARPATSRAHEQSRSLPEKRGEAAQGDVALGASPRSQPSGRAAGRPEIGAQAAWRSQSR